MLISIEELKNIYGNVSLRFLTYLDKEVAYVADLDETTLIEVFFVKSENIKPKLNFILSDLLGKGLKVDVRINDDLIFSE